MNTKDKIHLTDEWNRVTDSVEGVIQEAIRNAQDHAYQLGFERGCKEPGFFETYFPHAHTWDEVFLAIEALEDQRDSLLKALKDASCALTSAGLISSMVQADSAIAQCEEMRKAA